MTREKLLAVYDKLEEWVNTWEGGYRPMPNVTIAGPVDLLAIGDIDVWDSENGYADETIDEEELTVEGAIRCYKAIVADLGGWPKSPDTAEMC